jgi:hypothetical protein
MLNFTMGRYVFYFIAFLVLVGVTIYFLSDNNDYPADSATLAQGKDLFTKHCMSCHGLQDDGIGPPLGGITTLLHKGALLDFIKDPALAIGSGDERAMALKKRYKLTMPSFEWMTELEVGSILTYIHDQTLTHHIEPLDP